jgi:hypothetical protein
MLGDIGMRAGRWVARTGIICCVLILQGCFAKIEKPNVSAPAAEPTAGEQRFDKLTTPSGVEGQTPAQPTAPAEPNGPPPIIYFEQTTHDFGSVAPGSSNNCEFKFQNKGTGTLKITDVSKTCGCTVFTLDKKEYAPGEEGTLKVQFNADRSAGVKTRKLYVLSNDPNTPRAELTIVASVVQKVVYEPERLDYTLKGDKTGVAELTIRSVDEQPFAITKFEATADAVTANFDPNQKATKFVLQTKIAPQKMGTSNNGRIEITTTHPDYPSFTVPFSVLPRFSVDPPAINVLNAEPEKVVKKELWLLNNYGDDFDVNSATSKEGIIKVVSQEKLGSRYKFYLEITPPKTNSTARMFTDTFSISTKDGEKIDIVCRGFYQRK